ncbi:glycerol-3-phosphate 1-O-acyltransferase PlsY [Mycoplasma sp. 005V]|uniref:glycerol-3-phosphate 1-O-acyltransferase PlsY n=1 Tax=unclassified Mycoplasma TaxID=2683645 RepID=UPI003A8BF930
MNGNYNILVFTTVVLNIALLVMGYLIGSLNTSIIFSKFLKKDVRSQHSQNAGATNSSRVFGIKIGVLILLIDVLKTIAAVALATGIAYWVNAAPQVSSKGPSSSESFKQYQAIIAVPMLSGIGVVLGHCFPVFFGFKGGKGVASSIGLIISYNIVLLPIAAVFFFAVAFWKKYISLASMVAAVLLIPFVFVPWMSNSTIAWATNYQWLEWTKTVNLEQIAPDQRGFIQYVATYVVNYASIYTGFIYLGAVALILFTHRGNIQRLLKGEERKWSRNKKTNNDAQ